MKVWRGPEMEGHEKGIITLFVKSSFISGDELIRFLKEYPAQRIYLGAGRTDVVKLWPDGSKENDDLARLSYFEFLAYCKDHKITITVEVSLSNIDKVPEMIWEGADQVIVRIMDKRLAQLNRDDCIKIDTEGDVYISLLGSMVQTSLKDFGNDLFNCDEILYIEEGDK